MAYERLTVVAAKTGDPIVILSKPQTLSHQLAVKLGPGVSDLGHQAQLAVALQEETGLLVCGE